MLQDNPFRILGSMEIAAGVITDRVKDLRFEKDPHGSLQAIRKAANQIAKWADKLIQQEDETHG